MKEKKDKKVYTVWNGRLMPMTTFFKAAATGQQSLFAFMNPDADNVETGLYWLRSSPVVNVETFEPAAEDGATMEVETQNSVYRVIGTVENSNIQVACMESGYPQ